MSSSRFIKDGENKHASRLIMAFDDLTKETYSSPPKGVWGSVAVVTCNGVTISSKDLDLEFTVNFDDNLEPNEAEVIVYNLTDTTIAQFKKGKNVKITAGYQNDTGLVFSGYVDKVATTYEGADKVTTIQCVDSFEVELAESEQIRGNKAKEILQALLEKVSLGNITIEAVRDPTYENEQTVDGDVKAQIKKYAADCGISVYINQGNVYARSLFSGDNIYFTVCEDTGMIGSPAPFEEEVSTEGYTGRITGYDIEMLLQHRITTASIVDLSSKLVSGRFRVRSGQHIFNSGEAITKIKVIAPEEEVTS